MKRLYTLMRYQYTHLDRMQQVNFVVAFTYSIKFQTSETFRHRIHLLPLSKKCFLSYELCRDQIIFFEKTCSVYYNFSNYLPELMTFFKQICYLYFKLFEIRQVFVCVRYSIRSFLTHKSVGKKRNNSSDFDFSTFPFSPGIIVNIYIYALYAVSAMLV